MLTKSEIKNLIVGGKPPLVTDYINLEEQLQPNGFDCTLMSIETFNGQGQVLADNSHRVLSDLVMGKFYDNDKVGLDKGIYIITYNEIFNLPKNITTLSKQRSSLLRCGVEIVSSVGDAGYSGRIKNLLVVHNPYGFVTQKNARLLQMIFFKLSKETEGYSGIYQNLVK